MTDEYDKPSENEVLGKDAESKKGFEPSWLVQKTEELDALKGGGSKVEKRIRLLHLTGINALSVDQWRAELLSISTSDEVTESDQVEDRVIEYLARINDYIQKQDQTLPTGNSDTSERVAQGIENLQQLQAQQLQLNVDQLEMMRTTGFSGFVSAMDARAAINVEQFDTSLPVWYDRLSQPWKNMIRSNLHILLGSYFKLKSPVKGAEAIIASEDILIQRDALADMWTQVPGFRIALATLVDSLFDKRSRFMQLSENGRDVLKDIKSQKENLVQILTAYLRENSDLIKNAKISGGPEDLNPESCARFAVSAAWNILFLGNAPDSGDSENPLNSDGNGKPEPGRRLRDVQAFCPSVRTFILPRDQGASKWILNDPELIAGTDEGWGGRLGDWFAERIRHDPEFKKEFEDGKGVSFLIPKRLMYSLFDLTDFDDRKIDQILPLLDPGRIKASRDFKVQPLSMSDVLLGAQVVDVKVDGEDSGLVDYADWQRIDFRNLKSSELWSGYSDVMDSAWKVYQALIGRADEKFDTLALGNALSKLRKNLVLKDIYTGQNGERILSAVIISMLGGLYKGTSDILLNVPPEIYDQAVYNLIHDDRVFAGLDNGARNRLFKFVRAYDLNSPGSPEASMIAEMPIIGMRARIRSRASKTLNRILNT